MAKVIRAIELSGGVLLSKTALRELLVKVGKKNIFLTAEDRYFRIRIIPDTKCDWDWFGNQDGSKDLFSQSDGNIVRLSPYAESLVNSPAIMSPEEFVSLIEKSGEEKISEELRRIARIFGA